MKHPVFITNFYNDLQFFKLASNLYLKNSLPSNQNLNLEPTLFIKWHRAADAPRFSLKGHRTWMDPVDRTQPPQKPGPVSDALCPVRCVPGSEGGPFAAFYFPKGLRERGGCARCICMVQYRTFLGGQLRESILGPIGSEPGPAPNERRHTSGYSPPSGPPFCHPFSWYIANAHARPADAPYVPPSTRRRAWTSHGERLNEGRRGCAGY